MYYICKINKFKIMKYKVYAITDRNTNDIKYIGVTKRNLFVRLGQHLSKMEERMTRRDEWLLSLDDCPKIILLFEFDNSKDAYKKENELIKEYEINDISLFNESANFNRRYKVELKQVHQYDNNGNYLKSYKSGKLIEALNIGLSYKCINACCNGTKKSHKGFYFSFEKKEKVEIHKRPKFVQGKKVYQFTKDNVLIKEFKNAPEAAQELNIKAGDIWKCCNNYKSTKTVGCFKWSYSDKV